MPKTKKEPRPCRMTMAMNGPRCGREVAATMVTTRADGSGVSWSICGTHAKRNCVRPTKFLPFVVSYAPPRAEAVNS